MEILLHWVAERRHQRSSEENEEKRVPHVRRFSDVPGQSAAGLGQSKGMERGADLVEMRKEQEVSESRCG